LACRFGRPVSIPGQSNPRRQIGLGTGLSRQYHSTNAPHSYSIHLPQMLKLLPQMTAPSNKNTSLKEFVKKTTFFGKFRLYSDLFVTFYTFTRNANWTVGLKVGETRSQERRVIPLLTGPAQMW